MTTSPSALTMIFLLVLLLLQTDEKQFTNAYPWGAGGCAGGKAAVGGTHLGGIFGRKKVTTGGLSAGNVFVFINNQTLNTSSTAIPSFSINKDLPITVTAGKVNGVATSFKGILIRVQTPSGYGSDTEGILEPGSDKLTQSASACAAPVQGITHMNSNPKSTVTGVLRLDKAVSGVTIDVTVVYVNSLSESIYRYSRYLANFK